MTNINENKPGLNKFWKWMKECGYGHSEEKYELIFMRCVTGTNLVTPTKLMLVGYMIKYVTTRLKPPENYNEIIFEDMDDLFDGLLDIIINDELL